MSQASSMKGNLGRAICAPWYLPWSSERMGRNGRWFYYIKIPITVSEHSEQRLKQPSDCQQSIFEQDSCQLNAFVRRKQTADILVRNPNPFMEAFHWTSRSNDLPVKEKKGKYGLKSNAMQVQIWPPSASVPGTHLMCSLISFICSRA